MNNHLGINLKKLLKTENISENELAKRIGVPQQVINRIISGQNTNPKLATIIPIANYFKIPLHDLLNDTNTDNLEPIKANIPYVEFKDLQEKGINYAISQTNKFVTADLVYNQHYFATAVVDDSMEPKFSKGTILIFDRDKEPCNGDFCLLQEDNNNYLFRQIMVNAINRKFLKCLNPSNIDYTVIPLPINIYIIATLLESRTFFNT